VPARWQRADDGGLCVDRSMHVLGASADVFAAGDVCSTSGWKQPHWHQMRLWSQARLTGAYAAECMAATTERELESPSFELFTHTTTFFGQRVILLGRYNGQGLELDAAACVSYCRSTPPGDDGVGGSFLRLYLTHGRLRGAVLIGEDACDMCETYEHLILDELDLSSYGAELLDIDEDYFD